MTPATRPDPSPAPPLPGLRPLRTLILWLSLLALGAAMSAYVVGLLQRGVFRFNYPSRDQFPVQGIDVSHHQGEIAWPKLRGGPAAFAYIKATEGADFVDQDFQANWAGAEAAGLVPGAYHYFTLCTPGATQAANFILVAPRPATGTLPPAVDLEFGGNCGTRPPRAKLQAELRDFLALVEAHWGCRATLYVTQDFYERYVAGGFGANPLWVRDVFRQPRLADGRAWHVWQYANRARMDGIREFVDLDAFAGSEADFARFRCGGVRDGEKGAGPN
jgi:lysozyme